MKSHIRPFKKVAPSVAPEVGVLCILHAALHAYVADSDVVSRIFAASRAAPVWELLLAGVFLVVRFVTVLALPGLVAARLAVWLVDYAFARRLAK